MKRRDFIKTSTAVATSLGLPVGAVNAASRVAGTGVPSAQEAAPARTVTRLRVGTHYTEELRAANRAAREAGLPQPRPDPPDDKHNYWADLIKDGDRYFYRAGDTTVEISEFEYGYVQSNPSLYYFSQTVKVHVRMNRKRDGLPALPWKAT